MSWNKNQNKISKWIEQQINLYTPFIIQGTGDFSLTIFEATGHIHGNTWGDFEVEVFSQLSFLPEHHLILEGNKMPKVAKSCFCPDSLEHFKCHKIQNIFWSMKMMIFPHFIPFRCGYSNPLPSTVVLKMYGGPKEL